MMLGRVWVLLFPEVDRFSSSADRLKARVFILKHLVHIGWLVFVIMAAAGAIAQHITPDVQRHLAVSETTVICVLLCVGLLGMPVVLLIVQRPFIRRGLRRKLRATGVFVCERCGYDLRGSRERCPECGHLSRGADDDEAHPPPPVRS